MQSFLKIVYNNIVLKKLTSTTQETKLELLLKTSQLFHPIMFHVQRICLK